MNNVIAYLVDESDDKTLLGRIAAGDRHAFRTLMSRHLNALLSFSQGLVKNRAIAEEVTQETFLRVWQKASTWSDRGFTVKSWVYKICYNLSIDFLRKRDRETNIESAEEEAQMSFTHIGPTETIEFEEVVGLLEQLPERQMTAISLTCFHGLNNTEAAKTLDISIEALESLLARGRRKLKAVLLKQETEAES